MQTSTILVSQESLDWVGVQTPKGVWHCQQALWGEGFPGGSVVKNLPTSAGVSADAGSIPGLGIPGGGSGSIPRIFQEYPVILAWKISWTEEAGRSQSMGSQRAGHGWATEHTHTLWGGPGSYTGSTWSGTFNPDTEIYLCQVLLFGHYPLDGQKQFLFLHTYIRHLAPSKLLMIECSAINLIGKILKEQSLH